MDCLSEVDYKNPENHVDNEHLSIGFVTRQTTNKLLKEGDISSQQHTKIFDAANTFFLRATEYLLKWCPLQDELVKHATWLDFEKRLEKCFHSVEYFVHQYPNIFPEMHMDQLNEQFLNYQLLSADEIPPVVKETAGLNKDDPYQVDVLWEYLRGLKKPGASRCEFDFSSKWLKW